MERRTVRVSTALNDYADFPYLGQVIQVERLRQEVTRGKNSREVAYFVTSLTPEEASVQELAALIRGHWSIENCSHYVRDVTFREDLSTTRTRGGPQVMATLRNLAISLCRRAGHTNIAQTLLWFGRNAERSLDLIGL